MKTLADLADVKGKKVLVRVDFNVPVEGGVIHDDFRIRSTIPTIEKLRERGARIILVSHFEGKDGNSLKPIWRYLQTYFKTEFVEDIFSDDAKQKVEGMGNSDVVLFENIRTWKEEKENDKKFAQHLASFADVYVNEAFSASHREHASIVGVPQYIDSYAGDLFSQEIQSLRGALSPAKPFLFILGGAKFSTKLPLLEKFLKKADHIVVGGALMNNFFKEKGYEIGKSLLDDGDFDIKGMSQNSHLYVPVDVTVENKKGEAEVKDADKVLTSDRIMDIGDTAVVDIHAFIKEASFVLWNGPMGNYEKGYAEGTNELAHRIAEGAKDSIIGGGDTISVVSKLNLLDKFTHVSTAGGAMLDFLANETLPGIKALK